MKYIKKESENYDYFKQSFDMGATLTTFEKKM